MAVQRPAVEPDEALGSPACACGFAASPAPTGAQFEPWGGSSALIGALGCSLACGAHVVRVRRAGVGAKWIDVESAAAREPCEHRQRFTAAARGNVDEDALDAVLVEPGMAAIRDEIAQQSFAVDARTAIDDLHGRDIGLPGDRTYRAEQPARQRLVDDASIRREERGLDVVHLACDAQIVETFAGQLAYRLQRERCRAAQRHADGRAARLRD